MNDETTPTAPHPPSEEVAIAAKRTTRTMWQALLFGAVALLVGAAAVLALRAVNLNTIGERDAAQDQAQTLANGVVTGCASANVRAALTKAGQAALCGKAAQVKSDPQPGPKGDPGDPGAKGDQGDTGAAGPAPTQAQVFAAVQSYCATNGGCRGPAGASITQAQVVAAVATYCASGTCKGPTGSTGSQGVAGQDGAAGAAGADGKNGADSTVPGPQGPAGPEGPAGPGPSQAQINEAVTAYCSAAADRCTGPAGPKGDQGAAGTDGTDAVPFTFTFTIPADGPLKDAQTYTCTVTAPNDPVTCTRAA